jgi:V/A-type H+-transporting ATPase subunit A
VATGLDRPRKNNIVEVGEEKLLGEIIKIVETDKCVIQVFEDTTGIKLKEPVINLNKPLTFNLGPGMIGGIFDGIQRPLELLESNFIFRGEKTAPLSRDKKWHFIPSNDLSKGEKVTGGTILGYTQETELIKHYILVPPNINGKIRELAPEGKYTVQDDILFLENGQTIQMSHEWPLRMSRPFKNRILSQSPMITGQRILDFFFPLSEGGSAIIPGGFGTGKTILERTIAQYSSTDMMVLVLCGERGNEVAETLTNFRKLKDPRTGKPMIDRTLMVINTSNMPVVAREASIYSGITISEYFRDMGYSVSLMPDSTSRWAEALREISNRLGEIPGPGGYPNYLQKMIGAFYERSGKVKTLNDKESSVTIIGAVSPPEGDLSEPVTQASMRFSSAMWVLDIDLARSRHYPAINWTESYTQDYENIQGYFEENFGRDWNKHRSSMRYILKQLEELNRIVRLIGKESLSESQKGTLLIGRIIREGFLQQNAFSATDSFSFLDKTFLLAKALLKSDNLIQSKIKQGTRTDEIEDNPIVEELIRLKELTSTEEIEKFIESLNGRFQEIT